VRRPNNIGTAAKRPEGAPGFTLIELVISASLMSLILFSAYLCLNAAFSSQKLLLPRVEAVQGARVALALMSADLRNACPLSKDFDLLGVSRRTGETPADSLDFATHNYTPRREGEGDYCEVSLFLDQDPETGQISLWRRRNPRLAPDPLSGGSREELAKGVRGLRLEYYDGIDWYDSWGDASGTAKAQSSQRPRANLTGMPEAVRITLWCDPNPRVRNESNPEPGQREPPLVFQTVARLNLADRAQRTSGSESSTNAPAGPQAQPGPEQGAPGTGF
jgi:prepilin-type N-terminal cleavage/methylation domain-containing protein